MPGSVESVDVIIDWQILKFSLIVRCGIQMSKLPHPLPLSSSVCLSVCLERLIEQRIQLDN